MKRHNRTKSDATPTLLPVIGIDYAVTIAKRKHLGKWRVTAKSSLLDRDMHRRRQVELLHIGPGEEPPVDFRLAPFQLASWGEYLREQAAIRAALEATLRSEFAGWMKDPNGDVWREFAVITVALPDREVEMLSRVRRRKRLTEGFFAGRLPPAQVESMLDKQERLFTGHARSAFDLAIKRVDHEHVWLADFRNGELVGIQID
jgi:hypothetical protein